MSTERFLRLPQVRERVGISRSALYVLIKQGHFPKPLKLSQREDARASFWLETEINDWITARIQDARTSNAHAMPRRKRKAAGGAE